MNSTNPDPFASIRSAQTGAPNFGMDTNDIVDRLIEWQKLCSFEITGAERDTVEIKFNTLPQDMDGFVAGLYEFCPDLVDQGTGCVQEMIEAMEESGEEIPSAMQKLIEGVNFEDENYGLEILKREIQAKKALTLWWD
ncbi:MAG TPA: DUF4253 domain-containing protein [Verrucomicrobiae bacterium]|jgi:hypothetical protein|nr:DUF4253 domain-containing protein [Verrucomicrobiae bacterium]